MDHNGFHGFDHWMRVLHNGRLLADAEGANLKVVELFCLLHDTQRLNEDETPHTATGRLSTHRHSEASGSTLQTVKWICSPKP